MPAQDKQALCHDGEKEEAFGRLQGNAWIDPGSYLSSTFINQILYKMLVLEACSAVAS